MATAAGWLLLSRATATELTEALRQPEFDRYLAEQRRMTILAVLILHPFQTTSILTPRRSVSREERQ
jgi:hypothetical protein